MHSEPILAKIKKEWHGTLKSYLIGFFISLILTSLSFFLVINRFFSKQILIYVVVGLGLLQAIIQIIFFLHIGQEKKPRLAMASLFFAILILFIIVAGSLWIMHDLNNRVMPNMQMEHTHD